MCTNYNTRLIEGEISRSISVLLMEIYGVSLQAVCEAPCGFRADHCERSHSGENEGKRLFLMMLGDLCEDIKIYIC